MVMRSEERSGLPAGPASRRAFRRMRREIAQRLALRHAGRRTQQPCTRVIVIGLTGGVGAGKSTVSRLLAEESGADVLEADRIAAEAMLPGGAAFAGVLARFGIGVLAGDGTIDRACLAQIVYKDPAQLEALEQIVHPSVFETVRARLRLSRHGLIVYEAALPREARLSELCDTVWYVRTAAEERARRLKDTRGYSGERSRQIMANQLSDEEFLALADVVIENNGSEEALRAAVRRAVSDLKRKGRGR